MSDESDPNKTVKEEEVHAKFLVSASNYMNSSVSSNAVQSHFNILRSEMLRIRNLRTSEKITKKSHCQYCLTPWSCGKFSVKVLPVQKQGKKMKKLIRKVCKDKKVGKIGLKLFEAAHFGNAVVVKCLVCQRKSNFNVQKRPYKSCSNNASSLSNLLRAKKKRNNISFGLNPKFIEQLASTAASKKSQKNGAGAKNLPGARNENEMKFISLKRKRPMEGTSGMSELMKKKMKKEKNKLKPAIKANTLPITPPSLPHMPSASSSNQVFKCGNEDYITLEMEDDLANKNTDFMFDPKHITDQSFGRNYVLNPFSVQGRRLINMCRQKKLNKWKRLVATEERKPVVGSSLKDFLATL